MKYRLPPLNGLIAFEAAARTGNFARAAEELNLTQSTISHRVRMLERYLGYPLFERLPRGLRLTESGKAYLPSIRKAFEQIFSSTAGIFGRKDQGSLTVRAPSERPANSSPSEMCSAVASSNSTALSLD